MAMLNNQRVTKIGCKMTGWWYTYPSENYDFVSWDDYIFPIYERKNKIHVPNHLNQMIFKAVEIGLYKYGSRWSN